MESRRRYVVVTYKLGAVAIPSHAVLIIIHACVYLRAPAH